MTLTNPSTLLKLAAIYMVTASLTVMLFIIGYDSVLQHAIPDDIKAWFQYIVLTIITYLFLDKGVGLVNGKTAENVAKLTEKIASADAANKSANLGGIPAETGGNQ